MGENYAMPPKQRITREMILERSFAMFSKEGMEVVNARSVAKALNCSTQPIFSYYEGMEDLKNTLDQKARECFREAIHEGLGGTVVDCACAYVRFAVQQPRIFAHLFLKVDGDHKADEFGTEGRAQVIEAEAKASGVSTEQAERICRAVWTYAHGLAALQAPGWTAYAEKDVCDMLKKAYDGALAAVKG